MSDQPKRHVSFSGSTVTPIPKVHQDWKIPERYQVKQLIGTGSYGSVCEAYDKENERLVAVKRIREIFEDLVDCKRILREIAILSALSHDHAVRIFDVVMPEEYTKFDELYIVMEICDSDMKKLCRTPVALQAAHINALLYNLLVGCKYIHSAGVYHRDLKPANCLVNQDCTVKICDFGLARAVGVATELPSSPRDGVDNDEEGHAVPIVPHTQRLKRHLTGHVVTRWYRAPELILLQEDYTEQIDVWSIGCIFAELLGMLADHRVEDRGPLFPGSSCFPLSPDHKHKTDYKYHTKGKHDQLNMIFNYLGTPAEEDIKELSNDAQRYIKCFAQREGTGFGEKFKYAPEESQELLTSMLRFSPKKRSTVEEAMKHRLFTPIRDEKKETTFANPPLVLDFETNDLTEEKLRESFNTVIQANFRK